MADRRRVKHYLIVGVIVLTVWTGAAIVYALTLARQHCHPPGAAFLPFVGMGWLFASAVIVAVTMLSALMAGDKK